MIGKAISYGAISIINGIATGIGGAVGIDLETEALVKLSKEPGVIRTSLGQLQSGSCQNAQSRVTPLQSGLYLCPTGSFG